MKQFLTKKSKSLLPEAISNGRIHLLAQSSDSAFQFFFSLNKRSRYPCLLAIKSFNLVGLMNGIHNFLTHIQLGLYPKCKYYPDFRPHDEKIENFAFISISLLLADLKKS